MKVTFILTEPIRSKVGAKRVEVELADESGTVDDAFAELALRYPSLEEDLGRGSDELDANYSLFVNSRLITFDKRRETPVKDGDEISILLPMAGG